MTKAYIDSNIWIYHLEQPPAWGELASKLLLSCFKKYDLIIMSTLLLTEFLSQPEKDDDMQSSFMMDLAAIPNLQLDVIDPIRSMSAAKLRRKYKLSTPDAIHLATAIDHDCKVFYTHDKRLQKVTEIKIKLLK